MDITRELLEAEAPGLLASLKAEGAAAETERVKGCLDAALPGYEPLALSLALDGKTSPGEAAQAIIKAQRADQAKARTDAEKGPQALPAGDDPERVDTEANKEKTKEPSPQDLANQITAHIAKAATEGRTLTASQALAELNQQKGGRK